MKFSPHSLAGIASLLLFPLLMSAPAGAEPLYSAMAKAYENNPDLNAARAGLRATDEKLVMAKSGFRPVFAVEGSVTHANSGSSKVSGSTIGVTLSQPLFDGFQTVNNIRAAESQISAGQENLRGVEIDILMATAQAYADVIRDGQIASYRKQNIGFLREQLATAKARMDAGESTGTDVSQAEAQLAAAQALYTAADAQAKQSAAVYVQIVGAVPTKMQGMPIPDQVMPRTMDIALEAGQKDHPSVRAANYNVEAAGHNVKAKQGALLPGVSLSGTVSEDNHGESDAQIGVKLTIPIYQGGLGTARVREAKEQLGQQQAQMDSVRRAVVQAIVSSWTQMEASRANIKANKAQLRAANMALQGVIEELRVGQRTTLDVLNAQQLVLEAKESLAQSERNAVVAAYSVLASTGRLTVSRLGLQVAQYRPEQHYDATKNRW